MKQFLLSVFIILTSFPIFSIDFDYTYKGQTITYTVIDENEKTCMTKAGFEYDSPGNVVEGDLEIPSQVSFRGIEYSVISIGDFSFSNCTNLTSLTIPHSVITIGYGAFMGEENLINICIPNSVKDIGGYAFSFCSNLTSITIPNSVTSIGGFAFGFCNNLISITIPNSVISIGGLAFYNCIKLKSVIISSRETMIDESAFSNCDMLKKVARPNQCKFPYCESIQFHLIFVPEKVIIEDGFIYNDEKSIIMFASADLKGEYRIPNTVKKLYSDSFFSCSDLTTVFIPSSINEIESGAFEECLGLTSVYYNSDNPIEGPSDIFEGNNNKVYKKATLYVPEVAVAKYRQTEPWKNFKNIQGFDFSDMDSPREFKYTYKGQTLSYTIIDENAKTCMTKEGQKDTPGNYVSGDLEIPAFVSNGENEYSVVSLGDYSFSNCSDLTSVSISNSVLTIGTGAFFQCQSLSIVSIPNSVTTIDSMAFFYCESLRSIIIPDTVIEIGFSTFSGCSGLTSIVIPNSVKMIWGYAFYNCNGLTSIYLPDSLTHISSDAFSFCNSLKSVYYNSENPIEAADIFTSDDNQIYKQATLYVPEVAVSKCRQTEPWQFFKKIQSFDFSGVMNVSSEINYSQPYEIYSIKGVKILTPLEHLSPGVYIMRQEKNVKKIIIH